MARFIRKTIDLLTKPSRFFEKVNKNSFGILYFLIFWLAASPISILFLLAYKEFQDLSPFILIPLILVLGPLFTLAFIAIKALILHLSAKVLSISGNFGNTFRATIYAETVPMIYGLLAFVLLLVLSLPFMILGKAAIEVMLFIAVIIYFLITTISCLHAIFVKVIGLSVLHDISEGKAFLAWIIYAVVLVALFFVFYLLVFSVLAITKY